MSEAVRPEYHAIGGAAGHNRVVNGSRCRCGGGVANSVNSIVRDAVVERQRVYIHCVRGIVGTPDTRAASRNEYLKHLPVIGVKPVAGDLHNLRVARPCAVVIEREVIPELPAIAGTECHNIAEVYLIDHAIGDNGRVEESAKILPHLSAIAGLQSMDAVVRCKVDHAIIDAGSNRPWLRRRRVRLRDCIVQRQQEGAGAAQQQDDAAPQ